MQIVGNNSSGKYTYVISVTGAASGVIASMENDAVLGHNALVTSVTLIIDTVAGQACTLDCGIGDTVSDTGDTRKDVFINGIDATALGTYNNIDLDVQGATGGAKPYEFPTGDFILLQVASGSAVGLVGRLIVEYSLIDPAA